MHVNMCMMYLFMKKPLISFNYSKFLFCFVCVCFFLKLNQNINKYTLFYLKDMCDLTT